MYVRIPLHKSCWLVNFDLKLTHIVYNLTHLGRRHHWAVKNSEWICLPLQHEHPLGIAQKKFCNIMCLVSIMPIRNAGKCVEDAQPCEGFSLGKWAEHITLVLLCATRGVDFGKPWKDEHTVKQGLSRTHTMPFVSGNVGLDLQNNNLFSSLLLEGWSSLSRLLSLTRHAMLLFPRTLKNSLLAELTAKAFGIHVKMW